jgi:WD40 repeat protein
VWDVDASSDGSRFASAGRDGSARLWDARDGLPVGPPLWHEGRVTAVAFSPDGERLATATETGLLSIWDLPRAERVLIVQAHATWIQDLSWSPDGTRVLTAGRQDHLARLWAAVDGRLLHTLAGHDDNLMRGGFCQGGELIATVSVDGQAMLWDAEDGELLRTIVGPAYSVACQEGREELFTSGERGYAMFWDLRVDTRSAEDITADVARRSPWRLVGGRLERRGEIP